MRFLVLFLQVGFLAETAWGGFVFVTGDAGINNAVDGSNGAPLTNGNQNLFRNVLGSGTRVLIHNRFFPEESGLGTTAINNLFNSISGVTSTTQYPGGEVTSSLLSNIDLFVIRPRAAFSSNEIATMNNFVKGAGTLFLIGEHSAFNIAQATVNTLLEGIGSSLRLANSQIDVGAGYITTTNIALNPFTANVDSFTYNGSNSITGGVPLVRTGTAANAPVIVAMQVIVPEPSSGVLCFMGGAFYAFRRCRQF